MTVPIKNTGLSELDELCVQTIRFLALDAIQKANSGHPGMPMGMAAAAYTLWMRHLRYNPADPKWLNRDRFVLSAGHASMLLYSLLYLAGYDVSLDELKNFRQWGSRTPGHPEYDLQRGVEATTGPLGQGISNAVCIKYEVYPLTTVFLVFFNTPDEYLSKCFILYVEYARHKNSKNQSKGGYHVETPFKLGEAEALCRFLAA